MSSDETSELISFGGGVGENFLTRNLVVSHEPRLAKKDHAVHSSLQLVHQGGTAENVYVHGSGAPVSLPSYGGGHGEIF